MSSRLSDMQAASLSAENLDGAFGHARQVVGDEDNYLRVRAALESRDGAIEAYARFGDRIFNPDGSLVDDLVEFGSACRVAASFGVGTLVVMADGSRRPISQLTEGDRVLAWDVDAGVTVVETVEATLPHTDTLYEAVLSDGAVLSVTEDHLFFDAVTGAWVELAGFAGAASMFTLDQAATLDLAGLDWASATITQAYDLTVTDHHNYFIAADTASPGVLVHNANSKWTCTQAAAHLIADDPSLARSLKALDEALARDVADDLGAVVARLESVAGDGGQLADRLLLALANSDPDRAVRIAQNAAANSSLVEQVARADLIDEIFGGTRFVTIANPADTVALLLTRFDDLVVDGVNQRTIAGFLTESPRAAAMAEFINKEVAADLLIVTLRNRLGRGYDDVLADAISLNLRDSTLRQQIFDSYGAGMLSGIPKDARRIGVQPDLDFIDTEPVTTMFEHVNALFHARDGRRVVFEPKSNIRGESPPISSTLPDYTLDGEFVDAYMPTGSTGIRNIVTTAIRKLTVRGQAQRVDIILDRTALTASDVQQQFDAEWLGPVVNGDAATSYFDSVTGIEYPFLELTVLDEGIRTVIYQAPVP